MNRSQTQIKAAKARKEWLQLQEEKLGKEEGAKPSVLKKVNDSDKNGNLRDTA